jgi:hypothetical protein
MTELDFLLQTNIAKLSMALTKMSCNTLSKAGRYAYFCVIICGEWGENGQMILR